MVLSFNSSASPFSRGFPRHSSNQDDILRWVTTSCKPGTGEPRGHPASPRGWTSHACRGHAQHVPLPTRPQSEQQSACEFSFPFCFCCHLLLFSHSVVSDCDPMDCSPPGSSVHGISPARILKWVAISFPRESSQYRGQTRVSCTGSWILYHWATGKALTIHKYMLLSRSTPNQ